MSSNLYRTKRWRQVRVHQLRTYPLCVMCKQQGIVTPATVADHKQPHRGDVAKFWNNALQSLCATHHSSSKQREENRGHSIAIGSDGYPTDPHHTFNIPRDKHKGNRTPP